MHGSPWLLTAELYGFTAPNSTQGRVAAEAHPPVMGSGSLSANSPSPGCLWWNRHVALKRHLGDGRDCRRGQASDLLPTLRIPPPGPPWSPMISLQPRWTESACCQKDTVVAAELPRAELDPNFLGNGVGRLILRWPARRVAGLPNTSQGAWKRCCASSRPTSTTDSTASAAVSRVKGSSARSVDEKSLSTKAAGSIRPGGRPIPTRTRR